MKEISSATGQMLKLLLVFQQQAVYVTMEII
jgi:hypothetical protein